MKAATASLDALDKLQGKDGQEGAKEEEPKATEEDADEEIISIGATKAENVSIKGKRETDIERIRGKALMRRAKARSELGGWASLQGAEDDYKLLSQMKDLPVADKKIVQRQLVQLPARTKAAQEKEMGEMMGKLKQVSISKFISSIVLTLDSWAMEY